MSLSRKQFANSVSDETHVKLETMIDALRAMGFAVKDVSYRNDTDVSAAVYEGPEISDSDEPVVTVFVVDPESELHCDGLYPEREGQSFFSPYINDVYVAGSYASGSQLAERMGVEYAPAFDTLQELKGWLDKVNVSGLRGVAEEIVQAESFDADAE